MRILLVTPYYPDECSPAEGIFIHHQATALRASGHDVEVVHYRRRPPFWRAAACAPATTTDLTTVDGTAVKRLSYYWPARRFFDWGWCSALARTLRPVLGRRQQGEPTVIYAQWLLPTGAACARVKRLLGIPLVAMARGLDLNVLASRSSCLRRELDLVWREADKVLVNGEWGLRRLRGLGLDPSARGVKIVRNVLDLSMFVQSPRRLWRTGSVTIVTTAALDPRKGVDVLLRACARIGSGIDFRLVVFGDGSEKETLKQWVDEAGLSERVRFCGSVCQRDLARVLAEADIFVMPSRRDGAPNALVEAMASGLACVGTAVGGIPDLIEHEMSGVLVPPESPDALAQAISMLALSADLRRRLGEQASARVRRLYDPEANLGLIEEALVSAGGGGKSKI